jgi:hypothetical protein
MTKLEIELLEKLEGFEAFSYKDKHDNTPGNPDDNVTVGYGFNMDGHGARDVWSRLDIEEDFDGVRDDNHELSRESAAKLLEDFWENCEDAAKLRCDEVSIRYGALPEWHRFILADIVYNTGSISNWYKVIVMKNPEAVLYESRRKDADGGHTLDSRIAKIGYAFGLIESLEDAHRIGLTEAKYIS